MVTPYLNTSPLCSFVFYTHILTHTHLTHDTYTCTHVHTQYIGTFSIEMQPSWKNDIGKAVKHHLSKLKTKACFSHGLLFVCSVSFLLCVTVGNQGTIITDRIEYIQYIDYTAYGIIYSCVYHCAGFQQLSTACLITD